MVNTNTAKNRLKMLPQIQAMTQHVSVTNKTQIMDNGKAEHQDTVQNMERSE